MDRNFSFQKFYGSLGCERSATQEKFLLMSVFFRTKSETEPLEINNFFGGFIKLVWRGLTPQFKGPDPSLSECQIPYPKILRIEGGAKLYRIFFRK